MKPRLLILSVLTALLLTVPGCDDPAGSTTIRYAPGFESERSPYVVNGTVTDAKGNPVAGAEIHFLFTNEVIPTQRAVKAMPSTTIGYTLTKDADVSLKLFRLGTRELIATLAEGRRTYGSHTVSYDMTTMTNGFYVYQFATSDDFQEHLMIVKRDDVAELVQTTPLTRTDASGAFRLPHGLFGLKETMYVTSDKGPEIIGVSRIDSIGFVAHSNGKTTVQWMTIDPHRNTTVALTLQ